MQNLFYNGHILTMESAESPEAVLTQDEKIIAVGCLAQLEALAPRAQKIDLAGKTLMPAFIDAHSHFSSYASSFLQVPLDECISLDEIAQAILEFIRANNVAAGEWVLAKGYDNNALPDKHHPTAQFLDTICPDHPVLLQHASGHMGVLNSAALAALGITEDTPAPDGGAIGKTDGHLNGYLEENAFFFYLKKAPMPDMETMLAAYRKAQDSYASYGITTIQEGIAMEQMIPFYQFLLQNDLLALDLVAYLDITAGDSFAKAFPRAVKAYDKHLKFGGYKVFLDGSPQGRTAWMRSPYEGDKEGYCGYGTMTDAALTQALQLAKEKQFQILAHCNGDAAAEQFITCLARVGGMDALRPVMIHAQLLGLDQLNAVKSLGIIPSFFVAHVYHWGDIHLKNFGRSRAEHISPTKSALDKGILFTFHQDAPVIKPDMLETVWCAVNRRTKAGEVLGPQEKLPVYEALKAVTCNAAYQYFEEDNKGSIAPGKLADLVILGSNPLTVPPESIREIRVLETIKAGRTIYKAQQA